jgi:hypothetical protein
MLEEVVDRAILYMGAVVAMRHKECYQNFL